MTLADETILKTETKGGVQIPFARREQLLDEFEHSGLSGAKFAEAAGTSIRPSPLGRRDGANSEGWFKRQLKGPIRRIGWRR
jgi:hypothetical protein